MRGRTLGLLALVALAFTAVAHGQYQTRTRAEPPYDSRLRPHPGPDHRDNGVVLCRLMFASNRISDGNLGGWKTDFPRATLNLTTRLGEITTIRSAEPRGWVVDVGSPGLFNCPMVLATDLGSVDLTSEEAANLGAYLQKGGFVWSDDTWGLESWNQQIDAIRRAVPGLSLTEVDLSHSLYGIRYHVGEVLQMSHARRWEKYHARGASGSLLARSEVGEDSPATPLTLMVDPNGHHVGVLSFNTDIADGWERESHRAFFAEFGAASYAHGANVVLYAMTH